MERTDPRPVYTRRKPPLPETPEQLRARIPGWGVDLDPADRPSYPREIAAETGARWDLPEPQPEHGERERSIEHAMLTPVFGTAQPLHGLSGAVRRYAYRRHSEGKAMHWLLLLAADRVDVVEHVVGSLATTRPDDPLTETGLGAEVAHGRSRFGRGRSDLRHQAIDPLVNGAPWVAGALGATWAVRRLVRRVASR
ncbi:hypothetical protein [Nocardioides marmotae]|uniref:Uncharacterized protein n=1 Tax=Nocardioides marmotae TaxID=2663857 RepID=A0A6I3JE66_9ACTN|nr:hypothetical protein [Nocardioides marmotae]MCR6032757.1 hypothetical protein [Gordonia jinghuaiqii]MBC9735249.1 hypothetical protein [Nocardioides marmotae]MTB86349.1 hypothetical protein [Nocardioides marmotae]MTB96407.1 hypothetical protein [Nocardioides marmotae]QKE02065.1 hypothetical protein HPC71_13995 [Nocardioides marmotae]